MAVQKRNDELVDILSADFLRNKQPVTIHDNGGGWMEITLQDVAGTAQVIIPNASYDAGNMLHYMTTVVDSGGGKASTVGSLPVNSSDEIYNDATDVCTLRINADGSVDVRRTSGSATFDIQISARWL